LRGFLISYFPNPIDSIGQVYEEYKDIRIVTTTWHYFYRLVMDIKESPEWMKSFKDKIIELNYTNILLNQTNTFTKSIIKNLKSGKYVYVLNKAETDQYMDQFKTILTKYVHISKYGIGSDLYGIHISNRNTELLSDINNL
jgi:hypothetical protein